MNKLRTSGFSLLELLVTVSIVGILMSIAIPSFEGFIKSERLTSVTNSLISDMMLARSKAVELNQIVTVCASDNETGCNGNDYSDGWVVMADSDGDDAVDQLIRVQQPISGDVEFELSNAALSSVTFDTRGFTSDIPAGATFTIMDDRGEDEAKYISITRTGRISRGASQQCQ